LHDGERRHLCGAADGATIARPVTHRFLPRHRIDTDVIGLMRDGCGAPSVSAESMFQLKSNLANAEIIPEG
jgi:hypothetical protein